MLQSSLANLLLEFLGMASYSAVKVFRTFRCVRPLRALSRLQGLKVTCMRCRRAGKGVGAEAVACSILVQFIIDLTVLD